MTATPIDRPKYDLLERTAKFGESVIEYAIGIRRDCVTKPLVSQLVRAATSIGANYCEADEAATNKEFRYRIGISPREPKETKYWLRMIAKAAPHKAEVGRTLWVEADERNRIFAAIHRKSKSSQTAKD